MAATPTAKSWTLWWSAPAPAAPCWPSDWPAGVGRWSSWKRDPSGIPTRTGCPTRRAATTCTGPRSASSAAPIPSRWGRTTPGAAWAGPWSTTPATARASIPATSPPRPSTASVPTGPSPTRTSAPTTNGSKRELPVAGQDWPWGDPHRYPHSPHPVSGAARCSGRVPTGWASPCGWGRWGSPTARFGNRPHCIYRGYCLQGCKVNAKASPYVTHLPDALAHGVEIRSGCLATRIEIDQATGGPPASPTSATASRSNGWSPPEWSPWPATRSRPPACCSTPTSARFPHGIGNDDDQVGRYVMVQGATQIGRALARRDADVQGATPRGVLGGLLRDRRVRGFARGFSIQTVSPLPIGWAEHVLAEGHWGRALREYMRDYNHWAVVGVLNELLAPGRQPGHPGRRDGPTGCRSPASTTACPTTTGPTSPTPPGSSARSSMRPAPRTSSPSSGMPT